MKLLVLLLFVGVWVRHNTFAPLAELTGITQPGVFYILGGLWEAILCSVLLLMFWHQTKGIYRAFLVSAMMIGILEGLQMSVCRSLIKTMAEVPSGVNICDHVSGLPIGATVTGTALIITVWFIGKGIKNAKRYG